MACPSSGAVPVPASQHMAVRSFGFQACCLGAEVSTIRPYHGGFLGSMSNGGMITAWDLREHIQFPDTTKWCQINYGLFSQILGAKSAFYQLRFSGTDDLEMVTVPAHDTCAASRLGSMYDVGGFAVYMFSEVRCKVFIGSRATMRPSCQGLLLA